MISVLQDQGNVRKMAARYTERALDSYRKTKNLYGVYYYVLSITALFLAVVPGAAIALLQITKNDISQDSYNWFVVGTTICSSLTSLLSGMLSFFVVRVRYKNAKGTYYKILAEYLLFNTRTGRYADSTTPERDLFEAVKRIRGVRDPESFVLDDHPEDRHD